MVKKQVTALMSKGPIIGRKAVELFVDMNNPSFAINILDTGTVIKLDPQDVAAILNDAIKEALESEKKTDERIS